MLQPCHPQCCAVHVGLRGGAAEQKRLGSVCWGGGSVAGGAGTRKPQLLRPHLSTVQVRVWGCSGTGGVQRRQAQGG
eukprot:3938014-Rhodomonas_salina.2